MNYIELISLHYPTIGCHIQGDPNIYENIIHDSGDPIPDQATLDALFITAIKAQKWEEIKQYREFKKYNGIFVSGKWFHNDDKSRTQWLGLKDKARDVLTNGGDMNTILTINHPSLGLVNILWNTMDGSLIPVTVQLAFDVVEKTGDLDGLNHSLALFHKQQLYASSTPETYDFKNGWPLVYGENQ